MKTLSIGELARRTGIRTSALRYYEDAGILPKPLRANGRRLYDVEAVRRVNVLRFAKESGFTLDEVKTLFHGFDSTAPLGARWQKMARAKLKELDAIIERVQSMRRALEIGLQCGCVRIEDCSLSPADATNIGLAKAKTKSGCRC